MSRKPISVETLGSSSPPSCCLGMNILQRLCFNWCNFHKNRVEIVFVFMADSGIDCLNCLYGIFIMFEVVCDPVCRLLQLECTKTPRRRCSTAAEFPLNCTRCCLLNWSKHLVNADCTCKCVYIRCKSSQTGC